MASSSNFLHNILLIAYIALLLIVVTDCAFGHITHDDVFKESCEFKAIFIFGDSNSDTGGLYSAFPPQLPPYGETFFHRPTGRASDGRLIIDFIANGLGFPTIHPYLDSLAPNFSTGANFATGGSTIMPMLDVLPLGGYSPFSLEIQFQQFLRLKSSSYFLDRRGLFKMIKEKFYSQSLYVLDIGQNDINNALLKGRMSIHEIKASIPSMIGAFSTIVKSLYAEGGRSFWIHNTGPIGCLPSILASLQVASSQIDSAGCAIPYNKICQFFNAKLKQVVIQLRKDLPLAAIAYVDMYSVKYSLISNASKYGFTKPLEACCGFGRKYNFNSQLLCGKTGKVNGVQVFAASCNNPSNRISWDGIHYTEAANKWIYDHIKIGKFSDPPLSLNMACINKLIQLY